MAAGSAASCYAPFCARSNLSQLKKLLYPVKQEDISVSFGTVYHTLRLLVACGLAREIVSAKNPTQYERATAQCNHPRLVCKDCGASVGNRAEVEQ
jgi:Fe2+ or Zn2+ uptake regulation protein